MSGDLTGELADPVLYPHWMWIVGAVLLIVVASWIAASLWRWRTSDADAPEGLRTMNEELRGRYRSHLDAIGARRASGEWGDQEAHLAIAALMRSLGTERTGRDLESATAAEAARLAPMWPELAALLAACEAPSFDPQAPADHQAPSSDRAPGPSSTDRLLVAAKELIDA